MSLKMIIARQQTALVKCHTTEFVDEAIALMIQNNRNAVVIVERQDQIVGILTDHDVIRAVHYAEGKGQTITTQPVKTWMSTDVVSCSVETQLSDALKLMGRHKIRHLVVTEDGVATAVVSIRDVLSQIHENDELEAEVLRDIARASRGIVLA